MDFKFNQWHHGYLGLILLILNILFWHSITIYIISGIIIIDEIMQIFIFGQYSGLLHYLYSFIYHKFEIVRKINKWFDNLFK